MNNLFEMAKETYTGITVENKVREVTEAEIDRQLKSVCLRNVHLEKKEGPAELGDVANINYEGFKDGVPFPGGKGEEYNLGLGTHTFIPGFEEQLVGHKEGDEVDVKLSFPANYPERSLAGKPVVFKVKVNYVSQKVVPELNDEFAKLMGEESVDTMRAKMRDHLQKHYQEIAQKNRIPQLIRTIAKNARVTPTEEMMKEAAQEMKRELTVRLELNNQKLESFLQAQRMRPEDFEKELEIQGRNGAASRFILATIAHQEGLEATDADVDAFFESIAKGSKKTVEEVREIFPRDLARFNLSLDHAMKYVLDHATINE